MIIPLKRYKNQATLLNAPFYKIGQEFNVVQHDNGVWTYHDEDISFEIKTPPALKLSNLGCAIQAWRLLAFPLDYKQLEKHIMDLQLPCRQQWFPGRPNHLLDVAHNEAAVRLLCQRLKAEKATVKIVFSMLRDKKISPCIEMLREVVDEWFVTTFKHPRALSLNELKSVFKNLEKAVDVTYYESVDLAYQAAHECAENKDVVLVCGSFFLLSALVDTKY